ncbi:MAG: CBS domain-containing protein [Candidatus Binatia bacterium]
MTDRIVEEEDFDWGRDEPKHRALDSDVFHEPAKLLARREPITIGETATVESAIELMREHRIGCLLVTRDEHLVGIFTERDVLYRVVAERRDARMTKVGDVMTEDPESLPADAEIAWAVNRMSLGGFRHVPLVDEEGRPVGILSVKDVVNYLAEFFPDEVMKLPPRPGLDVPRTREGG